MKNTNLRQTKLKQWLAVGDITNYWHINYPYVGVIEMCVETVKKKKSQQQQEYIPIMNK